MSSPTSTPSPALPSTADASPYVPVSWMAVAALAVAGSFVAALLTLAVAAFLAKKPLIQPELLILTVIGVVLSFAARRMIRNSEGTRTGESLADAAWWVCIVGGLGYTAYLFGIEYSIRRDAEAEVRKWVELAIKGEPADIDRAFLRTLPPGRRVGVSATDPGRLRAEFGDEYLAFTQVDIVRLGKRSPGACRFVSQNLKDWSYRSSGIDCVFTGVIESPEGTFPVEIPIRGYEGGSGAGGSELVGRQWSIGAQPSGYVIRGREKISRYGRYLAELERSGAELGLTFLDATSLGPLALPSLYRAMVEQPVSSPDALRTVLSRDLFALTAVGGAAAVHPLSSEADRYFREEFLRLPGGNLPASDQTRRFLTALKLIGLTRPGVRIPMNESIDGHLALTIGSQALELRVPCEVPLPGLGGTVNYAARGRLILVCSDPAVLAEVQRLRANSESDPSPITSPDASSPRPSTWRVVRIESDLQLVRPKPASPAASGFPG